MCRLAYINDLDSNVKKPTGEGCLVGSGQHSIGRVRHLALGSRVRSNSDGSGRVGSAKFDPGTTMRLILDDPSLRLETFLTPYTSKM